MKYLIIGGSKSGKSEIAEKIALELNKDKVIYIATMRPYDKEDEDRIKKHIENRRGLNFITLEKEKNLNEIVEDIQEEDTVLIDSITSLLTNEMFLGEIIKKDPSVKILISVKNIIDKARNVIIVSDYIFNDAIKYDEITQNFKRELGIINREIAKFCDNVIECSFTSIKYHKAHSKK